MTKRLWQRQRGASAWAILLSVVAICLLLFSRGAYAAGPAVTIAPPSATVPPRGTQAFTAAGGSGAGYLFSMAQAPSGGKITAAGMYTAGPLPNVTDAVLVTDSNLNTATALVTVGGGVSITPSSITLAVGNTEQFTAGGGSPPYTWALTVNGSGFGSSISAVGLYTAGAAVGTDVISLTDSVGGSATATIHVVSSVPFGTSCTAASTCPASPDGTAYCTDGVCCSSACSGQCQACNTASSLGTCQTIAGPPVGKRPACAINDATNVCSQLVCDGQNPTACTVFVGPTVTCSAALCIDLVATPKALCQLDGGCEPVAATQCPPYACVSGTCASSCTNTSECSPGNYCDVTKGECVVPDGGLVDGGPASGAPGKSSSGCSLGTGRSLMGGGLFGFASLVLLATRRRRAARPGAPKDRVSG